MSQWTKCFHLPVQVVHSLFLSSSYDSVLPQPVAWKSFSVQLFSLIPAISFSWTLSVLYVVAFNIN